MTVIKFFYALEDALAVVTALDDKFHCDFPLRGRRPRCVSVDPHRPTRVYCGTADDGLWRSEDGGSSWNRASEGIGHERVLSVAVTSVEQSGDAGVVYAGTEPSGVFRSDDAGQSWQECTGLMDLPSANRWSYPPRPDTHHVRWLCPDLHRQGRLFAAIEAGALIRSFDGGAHWSDRTDDGPRDAHQVVTHRFAPDRLYAAGGDGYFESQDGGESWLQPEDGLQHAYVWSVAVDSADPDNILVSSASSPRRSHGPDAESFIYRRRAGGRWHHVQSGLPSPSGRRTAVLAPHPLQPATFFAAWEDEMFRSNDGGENWERLTIPELSGRHFSELCALVVDAG